MCDFLYFVFGNAFPSKKSKRKAKRNHLTIVNTSRTILFKKRKSKLSLKLQLSAKENRNWALQLRGSKQAEKVFHNTWFVCLIFLLFLLSYCIWIHNVKQIPAHWVYNLFFIHANFITKKTRKLRKEDKLFLRCERFFSVLYSAFICCVSLANLHLVLWN